MKTLREIKTENEALITFDTTQNYYNPYYLLCDADLVTDLEKADISGIIEYTLHRMKESGFTDEEINYNSNMYIPRDDEWGDLNEYKNFIDVDLGYILGGFITYIKFESEEV